MKVIVINVPNISEKPLKDQQSLAMNIPSEEEIRAEKTRARSRRIDIINSFKEDNTIAQSDKIDLLKGELRESTLSEIKNFHDVGVLGLEDMVTVVSEILREKSENPKLSVWMSDEEILDRKAKEAFFEKDAREKLENIIKLWPIAFPFQDILQSGAEDKGTCRRHHSDTHRVTVRVICPVDTIDMTIALSDDKGDQSGDNNDEHTK